MYKYMHTLSRLPVVEAINTTPIAKPFGHKCMRRATTAR